MYRLRLSLLDKERYFCVYDCCQFLWWIWDEMDGKFALIVGLRCLI